jgi:hypothetical protein
VQDSISRRLDALWQGSHRLGDSLTYSVFFIFHNMDHLPLAIHECHHEALGTNGSILRATDRRNTPIVSSNRSDVMRDTTMRDVVSWWKDWSRDAEGNRSQRNWANSNGCWELLLSRKIVSVLDDCTSKSSLHMRRHVRAQGTGLIF